MATKKQTTKKQKNTVNARSKADTDAANRIFGNMGRRQTKSKGK